ncbi:MAG: hypothetical protein P8L85_18805 [Rubripirellula sp.]|nr:hypothetical protein [Rubripirellula sp.]
MNLRDNRERARYDPEFARQMAKRIADLINDNDELQEHLRRFDAFDKKTAALGDGDDSLERLYLELAAEMNTDALALERMSLDQIEPWLDAALRKRGVTVTTSQACGILDISDDTLRRRAERKGIKAKSRGVWYLASILGLKG